MGEECGRLNQCFSRLTALVRISDLSHGLKSVLHLCLLITKRKKKRLERDSGQMRTWHKGTDQHNEVDLYSIFSFLQIFQGNHNPTDEVRSYLPKQTLARYIRIRPMTWEQGICMRFEIYGCRTSGNI